MVADAPIAAEEHLSKAIEHIKAAQRKCPDNLRDDELLLRSVTEVGAARAYIKGSRDAVGGNDGE